MCGSLCPMMPRTLLRVSQIFEFIVIGLLEKDRFKRMTLEEVLAHPWICKKSVDIAESRKAADIIE